MKRIFKRKYLLGLFFIFFFQLILTPALIFAEEDQNKDQVKVRLNGEILEFDVNPIIENGRTLVPLRIIFEKLGAELTWDEENQLITAKRGNTLISFQINSKNATMEFIDDKNEWQSKYDIILETPAIIKQERTLVPLRFVSESLGAEVGWDKETFTAVIEDKNLPNYLPIEQSKKIGHNENQELFNSLTSLNYFVGNFNMDTSFIIENKILKTEIQFLLEGILNKQNANIKGEMLVLNQEYLTYEQEFETIILDGKTYTNNEDNWKEENDLRLGVTEINNINYNILNNFRLLNFKKNVNSDITKYELYLNQEELEEINIPISNILNLKSKDNIKLNNYSISFSINQNGEIINEKITLEFYSNETTTYIVNNIDYISNNEIPEIKLPIN